MAEQEQEQRREEEGSCDRKNGRRSHRASSLSSHASSEGRTNRDTGRRTCSFKHSPSNNRNIIMTKPTEPVDSDDQESNSNHHHHPLQTHLPHPVTHVIFDMDGLLIDSEVHYETGMRNVCERHGRNFDWDIKSQIMGTTGFVTAEMIVRLLDLPIPADQFVREVEDEYPSVFPLTQMMPGVERLLDHLKKHKIPMAIASSSKKRWFDVKTDKFGPKFPSYFHHILLAPEESRVKECKPAPDTFLVCREMFAEDGHGVKVNGIPLPPPSSFLVFEDSVSGVKAGVRAGMQVVMVPDPRMDVEAIKAREPDLRPTLVLASMKDFRPEVFGLPPFDDNE